jgi:hypothetical protein
MLFLPTSTDPLPRLRGVHEAKMKGPDGLPLHDMVDLVQRIANDIQECASACDLYLNKNTFCTFFVAALNEYSLLRPIVFS